MSERFQLEYCGRPCGTGLVEYRDETWVWSWEMPDGSACAGTAASEKAANELLAMRVVAHYEAMQ